MSAAILSNDAPLDDAAGELIGFGFRIALSHGTLFEGDRFTGCTCGNPSCKSEGKHPIAHGWQNGKADLDAIRDQIARRKDKPTNIGVVLGRVENVGYVIAIDVDDQSRREALEAQHGPLPETLESISGRGTRLLYKLGEGQDPARLKNITALGGPKGVDVKAERGFIVTAPSVHKSGKRYTWKPAPIAEFPIEWYLAIAQPIALPEDAKTYTPTTLKANRSAHRRFEKWLEKAVVAECDALSRCTEGNRNDTLFRVTCSLLRAAYGVMVSGGEALVLHEVEAAAIAARLPSGEIRKTIDSARKSVIDSGEFRVPAERPESERKKSRAHLRVVPSTTTANVTDDGEILPDASEIFAGDDEVEERLQKNPAGKIEKTVGNVMTILSGSTAWQGVIRRDAFSEAPMILRQPPQRVQDAHTIKAPAMWSPEDSTRTAAWIAQTYDFTPSALMVLEAVLAVSQQNETHPVREYLQSLKWDGVARVDNYFATHCGAADNAYTRGVARMFFLSACARVAPSGITKTGTRIGPGCKVDTITVIEGLQGDLKSSMLGALAHPWFADTAIDLGSKDSYQSLRGIWVYELAELSTIKGRDARRIKSFASSPSDHYRPSYAPAARTVPRQTIFVGTTNDEFYLTDATGARRFWPVRITSIDLAATRRDRDQLWAEAYARVLEGESWWPSRDLEKLGAVEQEERFEEDAWEAPIRAWLSDPHPSRIGGTTEHVQVFDPEIGFTMAEIVWFAVGVEVARQDKTTEQRATNILHRCGWERGKQRREGGTHVRRWVRKVSPAITPGDGAGDKAGDA